MKSVLIHAELWPIVCGKYVKNDDATVADSSAFDAKDEKALASIILTMKPSQLNNVKHCKSSQEAWNRLKDIYQPQGPARKISLFKKLLYLRKSEGASIKDHINEFYAVSEQLIEIGVIVPEEMLTIILLSSLPKSYDNFVVAIETRDTLPSLNALKVKLLEEGERRQDIEERREGEPEQAFVARVRKNDSNAKSSSGDKSHRRSDNNKHSNVKCYNCGRRGHFAVKCRESKKESARNQESCSNILASVSENNLNRDSWVIDSGSTSHLCCDRGLFVSFKNRLEKLQLRVIIALKLEELETCY